MQCISVPTIAKLWATLKIVGIQKSFVGIQSINFITGIKT